MNRIEIGTCSIDQVEIDNVVDALQNKMLASGKYLHEFEAIMAQKYDKKHAIMVNSGQTALELGVITRVGEGYADIGVPALTYMATIWSALNMNTNAQPVFYDIELDSYGIDFDSKAYRLDGGFFDLDPEDLDLAIPVDLFGRKCLQGERLVNTPIIEDACEAVMNPVCNYGDYIALSFYSSHIMSCGSGGMILLDNDNEAAYIRSYIAHGRNHDGDFTKNTGDFMDRFVFSNYGQSLRSDNITAAIGMGQLGKSTNIINKRIINGHILNDRLDDLENDGLVSLPSLKDNVFMFYPLLVHHPSFEVLHFMEFLWDNGIDSRRFMPVISQPAMQEISGLNPEDFPNATYCAKMGVLLGCHQNLTEIQLDYVAEKITKYVRNLQ